MRRRRFQAVAQTRPALMPLPVGGHDFNRLVVEAVLAQASHGCIYNAANGTKRGHQLLGTRLCVLPGDRQKQQHFNYLVIRQRFEPLRKTRSRIRARWPSTLFF